MLMKLERLKKAVAPAIDVPVLIIESDDWGPGPESQAQALDSIRILLRRFKDDHGRSPVMTIGVVLSLPDPRKIAETGEYHARYLDDPRYLPIVDALKKGEDECVFDLQLHGLAHFWPDNFMALWKRDRTVGKWLEEDGWRTEKLPSWVQSRWMDAAHKLPSGPLPLDAIERAVEEEIECFHRCFARSPKVVVPPTFVWNADVERVYANAGMEVLITPGRRFTGRDAEGKLTGSDREYANGERLANGMVTLVRDVYFEPAMGHRPDDVLKKICQKWERYEPALLETHRFNFIDGQLQSSVEALGSLLEQTMRHRPGVRFLSSHELACAIPQMAIPYGANRLRAAWRRIHW